MGGLCTHLDHLISVRGQMGGGTPVKEGSKPYSGLMIIVIITLTSSYSGNGCDAIHTITASSWLCDSRSRFNNCDALCTLRMVAWQIFRIMFHGTRG